MKSKQQISQKMDYILIFILGSIFFALYIYTIFPGVGGRINYGDSAEWQYLHLTTGTAHPSGYPLFLLLSKLFAAILPFQTVAYRITAISIFFAVLTIIFLYLVGRLLSKSYVGSFLAAMLLGVTYTFWTQATEAEVYTLNSFFIITVIYLFLKFYLTKNTKYLLFGSFIYAISFGNHLSMILLLPALIYITIITKKTVFRSPRIILSIFLFILIGISQYGYIYYLSIHSHPYNYKPIHSFQQFINYITGKQFQDRMFDYSFHEFIYGRAIEFYDILIDEVATIGFIFIILGGVAVLLSKKKRSPFVFLLLILIFQGGYALNYNIMDIEVYYIPIYLLLVLFIPFNFRQIGGGKQAWITRWTRFSLAFLLMLTILFSVYKNMTTTDILRPKNLPIQELALVSHQIPEGSTILIGKQEWKTRNLYHYLTLTKELGDYYFTAKQSECSSLDELYFTSPFLLGMETMNKHHIELYKDIFMKKFVAHNKENIIAISLKGSLIGLSEDTKLFLASIGSHIEHLKENGSYIAIIQNNRVTYEIIDSYFPVVVETDDMNGMEVFVNHDIHLSSVAGRDRENKAEIMIDGIDYSTNESGLNIAIFNRKLEYLYSFPLGSYGLDRTIYKATSKNLDSDKAILVHK